MKLFATILLFIPAFITAIFNSFSKKSISSGGTMFALIKMAHIVAEARGAIAGTVFSKNTYGAYLRAKVTPVNPQTTFQQAVRQFLASTAQDWRGLTQGQRDLWNSFSINFNRTNIFGDSVKLTGFNLFMQLNRNLLEISVTPLTDAPTPQDVYGFTSASFIADTTGATMIVTYAPALGANDSVIVYATPPLSAGKQFAKSEFRKIQVLTDIVGDNSPVDVGTAYIAKFGALPPIGTKVFINLKGVSEVSGQAGVSLKISDIAI